MVYNNLRSFRHDYINIMASLSAYCLETEHPVLNFHLGKTNRDIVFIISNTFIDKGLSIAQMYKKDITTKGEGHGIGLHNVSEILNRYDNISHETLIEDGLFIQQVQIS